MPFIPDDSKEVASFIADDPGGFVPDLEEKERPPFGFAPGKELDPEGFGIRDEEQFKPDFKGYPAKAIGAVSRGGMKAGQALIEAPGAAAWLAGNIMELGPGGERRAVKETLNTMLGKKVTKQYLDLVDEHKAGQQSIIKSHPEWKRNPPKTFLKLLADPAELSLSILESTPMLIGAGVLAAAGRPDAAMAMVYTIEGTEAKDQALADGVGDEDASYVYHAYGGPAAIIEFYLRINPAIKLGKSAMQMAKARLAKKIAVTGKKTLTRGMAINLAQQAIEEPLQGAWQEEVAKSVYGKEIPGGATAYIDRRLQEAYTSAAMTLIPGAGGATVGAVANKISPKTMPVEIETEIPTDIPPGSNVYQTAEDRVVVETPADIGTEQGTELRDGRVYERATGEELFQVKEGTVSGIQDTPKSAENRQIEVAIRKDAAPSWLKGNLLNKWVNDEVSDTEVIKTILGPALKGAELTETFDEESGARIITVEAMDFKLPVTGSHEAAVQAAVEEAKADLEATRSFAKAEMINEKSVFRRKHAAIINLAENQETAQQYGLDNIEASTRLSEAEQQYQELSQKKTTKRSIEEEEELRFLERNRTNLESLIDRDTAPTKERVGAQRQKPYKSQYAAGHEIPRVLGMNEKKRREFMKKETGVTSMAKMTPVQAQTYIDALHKLAREKGVETGVLPSERKFKRPIPVFGKLTPQSIKQKILGVEFITKPAEIGKRTLDLEYKREVRKIDKLERIINTIGKETTVTKAAARLKNKPTNSISKFAELLNEHEKAPDWLTEKEKAVFNYFRDLNRAIITRENATRKKLDMELIPYKAGYMRHIIDPMARDMIEGKYPMPEKMKLWFESNTTMKINNPMEYQRKLGDELEDIFSKDLVAATKAMLWTGLREIHLSEPLKHFETQMALHSEVMPAPTQRWAKNFIKHMVKSEQTNIDQGLNDMVKDGGIGRVINKVLRPFGRSVSYKPINNLLGIAGQFQIYGVMGVRPKQLIRNKFQFIQNFAFSTVKNAVKGFIPSKQAKEIMSESLFMQEYLDGSGFEELVGSKQGRAGRLWMAGFRRTAMDNASRAMKVVYRDRLELVEDSKYAKFGWADPQRTYTEPKEFLYPSERTRIAAEMDFCAGAAQYNYTGIAAPEVFKYKALTPLTRLQSWWMNHFFLFHREAANRFFTGKTREGLRLPWSRRIGWGRYMVIGGVVLNTLGYTSSFMFGAAPESIPPMAQLITSMYLYLMADDEREKGRAKYKFLNALKTFIPGYLAKKDLDALLETDDWTKLLFYNKGIFKEED